MSVLLLQLSTVTLSLITLLMLPALPLSIFSIGKRGSWPEAMLLSLLLGCGSQATIGLLWSHLVGEHPGYEALAFFLLWGLITLPLCIARRSAPQAPRQSVPDSRRSHFPLLLILASAVLVRSLHPLHTAALGQSDAYTHLHYLHYIVEQGRLQNIIYPAGYHWVLALPVRVFDLDPYLVVRFCGAFFGTALVLAIYVFLNRVFNRRTALFGSFCAACFPGMMLLMKTGVGAFANQLGLFLVPCILYLYYRIAHQTEQQIVRQVSFSIACLGLAASVPMMMLHILIIFVLERSFTLLKIRSHRIGRTAVLILLCLPAVFLIAFHFSQADSGYRFKTAKVLLDYGGEEKATTEKVVNKVRATTEKSSNRIEQIFRKYTKIQADPIELLVTSPYFHLLVDFFTIKRFGFSNLYIDFVGWTLLLLYLICLSFGMYHHKTGLVLLGIWGMLTAVQASTGFLQFSSYQREGWSLLISTCCLSGLLAEKIYSRIEKYRGVRPAVIASMAAAACWTLIHPPGHPALQSSAEDLLIQTVRFLGRGQEEVRKQCTEGNTASVCEATRFLSEDLPLTIVTRRLTGWRNQGDIVPNVMPPDSPVTSLSVNTRGLREPFVPDRQYLVLTDRVKPVQSRDIISAFAMVAPSQLRAVLQQQNYLYKANEKIQTYISNLPKDEWQVHQAVLSENLTAYAVIPNRTKFRRQ